MKGPHREQSQAWRTYKNKKKTIRVRRDAGRITWKEAAEMQAEARARYEAAKLSAAEEPRTTASRPPERGQGRP